MKYPTLSKLRVPRRHKYGTPEQPFVTDESQLAGLLDDLKLIETKLNELSNQQDPKSSSRQLLISELRLMISLDISPDIFDVNEKWHGDLKAGIEHDTALIEDLRPKNPQNF